MKEPWILHNEGLISQNALSYDQYYCKPEIAKYLISLIELDQYSPIIEPCAGNGSFSLQIPGCLAYDIDPQHESIIKVDFLKLKFNHDPQKALVIGGPPFGRDMEMATKFFLKSASVAHTIAFILPVNFKNPTFELVYEEPLEENIFTIGGYEFSYPCSFQIYSKNYISNQTYKIKM